MQKRPEGSLSVAIVAVNGFSLLEFGSVSELSHTAMSEVGKGVLSIDSFGLESAIVACRDGCQIGVSGQIYSDQGMSGLDHRRYDLVVVLTGERASEDDRRKLLSLCRWCLRTATPCILTGAVIEDVARTRLADRVVVHWSRLPLLLETAAHTDTSDTLFATSGLVTTCAGGAALIDCYLDWIGQNFGGTVASRVANRKVVGAPRSGHQPQPGRWADRRRSAPNSLAKAASFIEKHFQEPLTSAQIARVSGVSTRQLERLFATYFECTPMQYLRATRLENGLVLLDQTRLSVLEIALASGFTSLGTFNKSFRSMYGMRASDFRKSPTTRKPVR